MQEENRITQNAPQYTVTTYSMEASEENDEHPIGVVIGCNLESHRNDQTGPWVASTLCKDERSVAEDFINVHLKNNQAESPIIPNDYIGVYLKRNFETFADSTKYPYRWLKVSKPKKTESNKTTSPNVKPDDVKSDVIKSDKKVGEEEKSDLYAIIFLDRTPRGVLYPKEQKTLLENYEKMGAITCNNEEEIEEKYRGKYRRVQDKGLLQMHVIPHKDKTNDKDFLASVWQGIPAGLAVLAKKYRAQPYGWSDDYEDRVHGIIGYRFFKKDDSVDIAKEAGWSSKGVGDKEFSLLDEKGKQALLEYWPTKDRRVIGDMKPQLLWKHFEHIKKATDYQALQEYVHSASFAANLEEKMPAVKHED